MLNEQASAAQDFPAKRPAIPTPQKFDPFAELRNTVAEFMEIVDEYTPGDDDINDTTIMIPHREHLRVFQGQLLMDSETAYDQLDAIIAQNDQFALFRVNETPSPTTPHEIHILSGRVKPIKGRPWVNLVLLIVTLVSVLWVGASYGIAGLPEAIQQQAIREIIIDGELVAVIPRLAHLWRGYPYALSLMLILGAHELGHYFAARRHGHNVSLPYFIPLPFVGLGTMGAVIRSREPMRNRKVLMDIGAAGPLAGMVFAIPILAIGLYTSDVGLITSGGLREGNSILYALTKILTLGQFYPTATRDVFINQMAFAGWLGMFVTALNLIPVGQLDGGHVMYSLFGQKARRLYYPIMLGLVALAMVPPHMWLLWVVILTLIGRFYAPPLDDITPLDPRRRGVAILTLVTFVLVFVPIPFQTVVLEGESAPQEAVQQYTPPAEAITLTLGE